MWNMPDNYDLWEQHEREQEKALEELPVCAECGEPIQTEFCYEINGEYICEDCIEGHKVYTSDIA